jgi:hypothetical protein
MAGGNREAIFAALFDVLTQALIVAPTPDPLKAWVVAGGAPTPAQPFVVASRRPRDTSQIGAGNVPAFFFYAGDQEVKRPVVFGPLDREFSAHLVIVSGSGLDPNVVAETELHNLADVAEDAVEQESGELRALTLSAAGLPLAFWARIEGRQKVIVAPVEEGYSSQDIAIRITQPY